MTHLETRFEIKSWDEDAFRELPDGQKLSRATVALAAAEPAIEAEAGLTMLLFYRADGTSSFMHLMHVTGRLGERTGGFVLQGTGTYDGTRAQGEYGVVPGSGTGGLAGIRGGGESVSTHRDYPYMPLTLDYQVE